MESYINTEVRDKAYQKSGFYHSRPPLTTSDLMMCVNERLVVVLTLISNGVVVMVFFRVLGLTRLASSLIVSIACSNIVGALAILLHSLAVTNLTMANSEEKCRFLQLVDETSSALKWSCLACAIFERLIAINMPSQYLNSMTVMAPTLISAPWVYWIYRMAISFILGSRLYRYDMGFICQDHLMQTLLHDHTQLLPTPSFLVSALLVLLLAMSRTLHPPYFDDMWEANRLRLENKTTAIMFQLVIPTYLLYLPRELMTVIIENSHDKVYNLLIIKHVFFQLSIYNGPLLCLVLMQRKEFRRAFRCLFAGKAIRSARPPNYLVIATESTRRRKSLSPTEVNLHEIRFPVAVSARDDYRSLIPQEEVQVVHKKKLPTKLVSVSSRVFMKEQTAESSQ